MPKMFESFKNVLKECLFFVLKIYFFSLKIHMDPWQFIWTRMAIHFDPWQSIWVHMDPFGQANSAVYLHQSNKKNIYFRSNYV